MKTRLFVAIVLLANLMLALNGGAAAQGNPPPFTPSPDRPPQQPTHMPDGGMQAVSTQALSLGQPGTSFHYVQTFGVTEEAYLADVQHINDPVAVSVDGNDNVFVVEEMGSRVLEYRGSDGVNLLSIGKAGMQNRDTYSFDDPRDLAVDGDGNIWVADSERVAKYDAGGHFLLQFPSDDPGAGGSDNAHFSTPRGLAFDSAGRLYVSDANNERIQVFNIVSGVPVYNSTIGVTGVSGSNDGYFNYPSHIAFDSSDRLYVADANNFRVQRCTLVSSTWNCTTFFGEAGVTGADSAHLGGWFNGLTIHNNNLYIADEVNQRVLKCNPSAACSVFAGVTGVTGSDNTHFRYPSDVAVDSAGNVYVSEYDNHRVQKFNSSGTWISRMGVTQVAYVADDVRFNAPAGMTIGTDGSIYFVERQGYRLVKLNASGVEQWTAGQAGTVGSDNAHFGWFWDGLASYPAIDGAGKVYVPDPGNNRIQIFDASTGAFLTTWGSSGSGPSQFNCPQGVTISPVNGDFYVADRCNNRVQVFNSSRVYKMQLGTGNYGSSNTEFAAPTNVAVDEYGAIFVTDTDNNRIQKCTISGTTYNCSLFTGVTGVSGTDFSLLSWPHAVALDDAGRVYVTDSSNTRLKIYDSSGALLTTLGGDWNWGSLSGEFREPMGLALDQAGNLYVGDSRNARIEKFALGVAGWEQTNINGFGGRHTNVASLDVFNNQLYAGTANWDNLWAQVWRSPDGRNWSPVSEPGFGVASPQINAAITDLQTFNGKLYAGTGWGTGGGGQLWRSPNGTAWEQVVDDGFGDSSSSLEAMTVFDGSLYIGVENDTTGFQIWRSGSGDNTSWTNVLTGGFGDSTYNEVTGWATFNGYLYAAISAKPSGSARILRTDNGTDWEWASLAGLGDASNDQTGGFAIYNDYLYIGTNNNGTGGQIWRSSNGSTWTQVMGDGFGDINNHKIESLYAFGGSLYAGTDNTVTGIEIWRSSDDASWHQVNPDGFGLSTNNGLLWSNEATVFNNLLYYGTWNNAGGQVWELLTQVYLPLVIR